MSNKDWMDYTNLAANIHQSIKLGEISNQLNQLTSINTAMLGNMNNLVNIEVYKLEQEDNEKQFRQLLFNLKKFVKTKYEDSLSVALLKNGHCKMIDSLLENFQVELKSFEDKEYVENIMDIFNEYSSADVDFEALAKENEDGVTLLLSYMMITNDMASKEKKIESSKKSIEEIRKEYVSPMQEWTISTIYDYLNDIGSSQLLKENDKGLILKDGWSEVIKGFIKNNQSFQMVFENKVIDDVITAQAKGGSSWFQFGSKNFNKKLDKIENEILPSLTKDLESASENLSKEMISSMNSLSDDLNKSNAEWINVEKKLLNIMYDTTLPIQGPYQYRKQVIGE